MTIFNLKKLCSSLAFIGLFGATAALAQDAGGQFVVERIKILGARKTKAPVIHRYLRLHEGGQLSPELIERDQQALLATNFFKRVEFSTEPGSEKGKVIVVIEVQERRAPTLEFAGGYSELDGWYFSPIGVRYDNLFGTGHFLGMRVVIGDRVGGFNTRFSQPLLFNRQLNLQLDFDALGRNLIHYFDGKEAIQEISASSLRVTLAGARGLGKFVAGGYQTITAKPDSFAKFVITKNRTSAFPPAIASQLGETKTGMFWLRLQADTRDNAFFPHRGFWGALTVERADKKFGGDTQFTRRILDLRLYQNIRRSTLALRLKAATTSAATPFYERFYLGGAYSLRGFAERSLTPAGYGTRLVLGNLEWRVPLGGRDRQNPNLVGVIFFDAGSIGTPETKRADDESFSAAGFGARWKVPVVGWLRFDFAYPKQRPDDFRFHLAIGHPF
jgi:outer membrane protein insertion porin family